MNDIRKDQALTLVEEIKARGLDDNDIVALGASEPVSRDGLLAFRQGLAEGATGEQNPNFPIELRQMPEYGIGTRVVELSQIDQVKDAA